MNQSSKITGLRYVLAVKDLEKSAAYYANKLGFKTLWKGECWHFLGREKFIVMLGECPGERSAFETANHSYFAYVDVENVDALYLEFKSGEVDILSEPTNEPWGQRELAIRTIDGHRIRFGEEIKS